MAEIADGLSAIRFRQKVASILRELENADDVTTVSASQELFQRSMELFESRDDKDWGFTDCSSFVVMKKKGIIDALTTDEHFRQAGFNALMLDPIN